MQQLLIHRIKNHVKEGRATAYRAAKLHNVCLSTLVKWCKRDDIDNVIPSVGRPCFLGENLEKKLKEWIFEDARTGELPVNV